MSLRPPAETLPARRPPASEARPAPALRPTRRGMLALGAGLAGGLACAGPPGLADRRGLADPRGPAWGAADPEPDADELDLLLGDLEDASGAFRPIEPAERAARRRRTAALLGSHGVAALLVEAGATMDYLCGVDWGRSERLFAFLLFADGSHLWVAPAFEEPRARARAEAAGIGGDVLAWDEHEYAFGPLAAELGRRRVERVAIEPASRAFVAFELAGAMGAGGIFSATRIVLELRGRKEERELELLRAANELTQRAIATVAERAESGWSDRQLGAAMRRAQERLGLTGVWVLPLLGPEAALPHGSPVGRVLEPGIPVLVDTGGALHGYQSDETRSWIHDGAPGNDYERAWNAVRDAQLRGFEALRPGVPCASADRAARAAIAAAGYDAGYGHFAHRLGHGIGLEVHEAPYLDGGSEVELAPGMTFSDEPGIYLSGEFGIRLEDIVAVTADGADHFGSWQSSPRRP